MSGLEGLRAFRIRPGRLNQQLLDSLFVTGSLYTTPVVCKQPSSYRKEFYVRLQKQRIVIFKHYEEDQTCGCRCWCTGVYTVRHDVEFANTHLVIQTKDGCMPCSYYEAIEFADVVEYVKLEDSA